MTPETPNLHVSKNLNISKTKTRYRETENAIKVRMSENETLHFEFHDKNKYRSYRTE